MINFLKKFGLVSIFMILASQAHAENMITIRINDSYNNVMISIKDKLNDYGYKIAHIQKCDGGLHDMGYASDEYKLIFFGNFKEIRAISKKFPQIIPYIPLKIAVIKENDSVVLVALNPSTLSTYFKDKELHTQFGRWENDLRSIFSEITEDERLALLAALEEDS